MRLLVFIAGAATTAPAMARGRADVPAPCTDSDRMNAFAVEYARYAEALNGGVIDTRTWRRLVEKARGIFV